VTNQEPARARRIRLSGWLFVFGILSLSYLLGATVMFFELPTSSFLTRAFAGERAGHERREGAARAVGPRAALTGQSHIDVPGKTFDGYTLYSFASVSAGRTQAALINMKRDVVHNWDVSFNRIWPEPPQVRSRITDEFVCIFGMYVYGNGDLLAVFHGLDGSANGYGLVKLDKDSRVIWKYEANVHDDVDVGPDGTIYALQQETLQQMPSGLNFISAPCLVDYLVMLSPEGKLLRKPIPILEALRDSPYAPLLGAPERPTQGMTAAPDLPVERFTDSARRKDVLHTNSVKVLSPELAPKFPGFKAGQVLISMRNLDTIAMLDPESRALVWAARGPWRGPHDPQFLANGRLLIFDGLGAPRGSRVLEYDPRLQSLPWTYAGANGRAFRTKERGMSQRLANGNTLVVDSEGGEILEVTHDKELVWSCGFNAFIPTARRYGPGELPFLKGTELARP